MPGRKPSSKQDFFSMLLDKLGLVEPKKGKKKRRQGPVGPKRPAGNHGQASPFGDYGHESGLGFQPEGPMTYEAAAAAGYAPPQAPPMQPLFQDVGEPLLPLFGSEPAAAPPPAGKLFNEDALDQSLDAIFADLETGAIPPLDAGVSPAPAAALPFQASAEPPKKAPSGTIVSFPKAQPAEPPRPKVPTRPLMPEPVAVAPEPAPAMVIPAEPTPTVTLSQGQDLRTLLATVDRVPGVSGSLLVGYDGLIILTTLPPAVDRDYLGAQACNMFTGVTGHMQRLERGELRRMVLETSTGAMLMTAADMGILVVVSDGQALDVRAVSAAIAGALGRA